MNRGQISWDFLIISAAVLMLFLVLLNFYSDKAQSIRMAENSISAKAIADSVARGINAVERGGNGTRFTVAIPGALSTGDSYNVSILSAGRRVEVAWFPQDERRSETASTLTSAINGLTINQSLPTGPSNVTILNINGVLNVST